MAGYKQSTTEHMWSMDMPESWQKGMRDITRKTTKAIDEEIIRTQDKREIRCEYDTTKWKYVEPLSYPPRPGRKKYESFEFDDPYSRMTAKTMMAMIIHTREEIHFTASNGIYIVSIRTGTQWKESERRLHICRMDDGMMADGNLGIVVNEGAFNAIMEAINEYNRCIRRPPVKDFGTYVTQQDYMLLSPEEREMVRNHYYRDEYSRKWVKVPGESKLERVNKIEDKILTDDMFKVE